MATNNRSNHSQSKTNGHVKHQAREWDDVLPLPKLSFTVAAAIVFFLAVLCFANSYDGDFVFDDSEAINANKDLLPETPLADIFSHDFWGRKLDSKSSHKSYRPLTVMTYRWNYALAGGLHPMGFHVMNILLHGVVSVLFLAVFSVLVAGYCRDPDTDRVVFAAPRAALLCAVLFAVHPVHTESVAGVVGRADLLCALTFQLSFLLYVKACVSGSSNVVYKPDSFSPLCLLASMCLCAVSTFCKEQGITVIGVCSAYDILVMCRVDPVSWLRPAQSSERKEVNGHSGQNGVNNNLDKQKEAMAPWLKSLIMRHIVLLVTGVTLLVTRLRVMGSTTPIFQVHDNPHSFVNGTLYRMLNYNYLYAINSWLLLNPTWLCFDWSMGCIPLITSLADPRLLANLAFWLVLGGFGFHCCRGDLDKDRRVLMMSVVVMLVPFLPASNLFFRVGFVIAERILYLSSAGFCLLVCLGARRLSQHPPARQVVSTGFYFIVIIFIIRCIQRSNEWRHEMSLFTSGINVCPLNAKVHYNIAKLQGDNNNIITAIEEYRLAIKLNPEYDQAMNNLANILKDKDGILEAEQLLTKAVSIRPDFAAAWMNLGIVQAEMKKNESAERSYLEAISHRRKYPDCYYNLGNLAFAMKQSENEEFVFCKDDSKCKYLDTGRHADAMRAWLNATQMRPTHVNAWTNTLILLDQLGRYEEAVVVGREALKVLKDDPQLLFNIANIYGKMQKYPESEQLFLACIKQERNNAKYHLNLGVLYHRWAKYDKAETAYLTAQRLNPGEPVIKENLDMLYRKMGKPTP